MELFFQVALSFPTVIYSFLLCVAVVYWCIAAVGLLDIDCLDLPMNTDIDLDISDTSHDVSNLGLAGILIKFGLDGIPLTIILTILFFLGFLFTYFLELFVLRFIPLGFLRIPLGFVIFFVFLFPAAYITGILCRPFRKMIMRTQEPAVTNRSVIGQVAIVRTQSVSRTFGEATYFRDGIELILEIRADHALSLQNGERVVLLKYNPEDQSYDVIREKDF